MKSKILSKVLPEGSSSDKNKFKDENDNENLYHLDFRVKQIQEEEFFVNG